MNKYDTIITGMDTHPPLVTKLAPLKPKTPKIKKPIKSNS